MLLHQLRIKDREKEGQNNRSKRELNYLKDEKEIDILEEIYSKVIIEKLGLIITIVIAIIMYFKGEAYFTQNTYELIFKGFIILIGVILTIGCITVILRGWKCREKIKICSISNNYLRWIIFKRIFKFIVIGLYLYSFLMVIGEAKALVAYNSIIGFRVSFLIASGMTLIGLMITMSSNSIRGKFVEVSFENIASGLEKGQLDIAKESLAVESKERMLWGEGYIIINRQIEVLIERVEEVAKEEENSLIDRTELITNASHDIRTPLTSILNYIEILKSRNISDLEREECIRILVSKAERLKALIEDLKYATDFSIGEAEIEREPIDIIEILDKSLAENQDNLLKRSLDIINDYNVEKSVCYIDRNNTMRIFQNLLSNIAKYSLEGSRVYISVEDIKNYDNTSYNKCKITFKNISKDKLNIKPEELIKRFKRGDTSRSEPGHGLGLDIVKNLMRLQYGNVKIDIQGDLFKVELIFDK